MTNPVAFTLSMVIADVVRIDTAYPSRGCPTDRRLEVVTTSLDVIRYHSPDPVCRNTIA